MLGRQPRLLEVLRPRLKACASLWLLLIHARQSRACGAERLRQRRRLIVPIHSNDIHRVPKNELLIALQVSCVPVVAVWRFA